jgi:ABC-type glycerol-3-phosphate transport system permease component
MTTTISSRPMEQTEHVIIRKKITTKKVLMGILKYAVLILISATYFFPLFWMVSSSLKNDSQVYSLPPVLIPIPAHWENFINGWTRLPFTQYAINSLFRYCLPVTLFALASSVVVAYGFSRLKWPGRDVLFYVCIATMIIPLQVTMVPLFITYKHLGWINSYRPLVVPALFGQPYFIFLLRQFFMGIPEELSDAARIDGASEIGILIRIILPLSVPAMAVVALFRFVWSWNDYLGPLIYLNNDATYPLALGIQRLRTIATSMGTSGNAYPHLMAVSTIVALPIILLFFFAQRTFIEGISLTGLKG